ncbi:hypothetical protein L4D09_16070 [Photobacterium makurazakiensis]|uniref:hypothetical protein n=1 Tax=Photobacterium makurazakiensis TaxID=2910234 RepID=UPI003D0CF30B
MRTSEITVNWPDLPEDTHELLLSLEGEEMMMGVYKLVLTPSNQAHQYKAELMLPFCTSNEMTWQGTISSNTLDNQSTPINISIRMIK